MKYRIVNILHSGRKGFRNSEVLDSKYQGMISSVIKLNEYKHIEDVEQYKTLRWTFEDSESPYEWWETSAVIGLAVDWNNHFRLETVNTIYVLEALT